MLTPAGTTRVTALLAAAGAAWEAATLEALDGATPGVVLLKRCLDLPDAMAAATTGMASVLVVSPWLPGLDADAVAHLRRHGVAVVAVGPVATELAERLTRVGVAEVTSDAAATSVVEAVRRVTARSTQPAVDQLAAELEAAADSPTPGAPRTPAPLVVVWGPGGGIGRTTVAVGVAAEFAYAGRTALLLDCDPGGGAVAQHLAVVEEVSGLLSAARVANAGQLEPARLAGLARQVAPGLRLLTGLPRPDRWPDVRAAAFEEILTQARLLDDVVVVDAGSGLEPGRSELPGALPARGDLTAAALDEADLVVVVVAADPVGLARLARALLDLAERRPGSPVLVVVNRMRPGLGWDRAEVEEMVTRLVPEARVLTLPEDQKAADRALLAGRTLTEAGDSVLRRALREVAVGVGAEVGVEFQVAPRRGLRGLRRRGPRLRR